MRFENSVTDRLVPSILVLDDEPFMVRLITQTLEIGRAHV